MDAFVIDASIAVAWVHPAQATDDSAAWLEHIASGANLVVPSIWPLEVSNALLVLQRRRKLTAADRANALRALERIPIRLEHESVSHAFADLSELAVKETLSVYDAAYLELAIRRALPL